MPDLREGVPHVPDLAREGLAVVVAWRDKKGGAEPAAYRLTRDGQDQIYAAMTRNAHLARTDPTQAPHRLVLTHRPGGEPS